MLFASGALQAPAARHTFVRPGPGQLLAGIFPARHMHMQIKKQ